MGDGPLRAVEVSRPDLCLCDIFMPRLDGLQTLRELRRRYPALPVVTISGGGYRGDLDVLREAEALGASATIEKPFQNDIVWAVVGLSLPRPARA